MRRNRREAGITLVEVILFSAISAGILLWASRWFSAPARLQGGLQAVLDEQQAFRAIDVWVNDLKEVIPGSVTVESAGEGGGLSLDVSAGTTTLRVRYRFEPGADGQGSLKRVTTESTIEVVTHVLAPDAEHPLFRRDTDVKIVMLDLRKAISPLKTLRLVRRVALPD